MPRTWTTADEEYSSRYAERLRAAGAHVGAGVSFGAGAEVHGDEISIGDGTFVGPAARIQAPWVRIGRNCALFSEVDVLCRGGFTLGSRGKIGRRTTVRAHTLQAGRELWCGADVEIGGGGWESERAVLEIGDVQVIGKRAYVNVGEPVTLAGYGALSIETMVFTHGGVHCQSFLDGHPWSEAAVTVGRNSAVLVRAIVLPGVSVGEHAIVAAGAVVASDVPSHHLAAGVPARAIRRTDPELSPPQRDRLMLDMLRREFGGPARSSGRAHSFPMGDEAVVYAHDAADLREPVGLPDTAGVVLAAYQGEIPEELTAARPRVAWAHLGEHVIGGLASPVSERLRDKCRRRGLWLEPQPPYEPPPVDWLSLVARGVEEL